MKFSVSFIILRIIYLIMPCGSKFSIYGIKYGINKNKLNIKYRINMLSLLLLPLQLQPVIILRTNIFPNYHIFFFLLPWTKTRTANAAHGNENCSWLLTLTVTLLYFLFKHTFSDACFTKIIHKHVISTNKISADFTLKWIRQLYWAIFN